MQKITQIQSLTQKLSPQQIQFIKLLQVPTAELQSRIEEELAENPALEEGRSDEDDYAKEKEESGADDDYDEADDLGEGIDEEYGHEENESLDSMDFSMSDYMPDNDDAGYKMQGDGPGSEEDREMPLSTSDSLTDSLMSQLGYLDLDEREYAIGVQLIGNIDSEGYIRRELQGIVNDLVFTQNIETDEAEVERILHQIQTFEPPGIAARNLQECLELQLKRKDQRDPNVRNALRIISLCFDEFIKKHYHKIEKRLDITEEQLKEAVDVIVHLNPKPGESTSDFSRNHYITPDFILRTDDAGRFHLTLNARNAPDLRISRSYMEMLDSYEKGSKKDKTLKQAVMFLKQKLDAAKWFIDAIKQRQQTLLKTMNAIVEYQQEYFREGDESKLKPMILKDIAQKIGMDISTVSRVANSKSVQTEFGVFPLKHFFSESISTDSGEDVSSKEVKFILKEIIDNENKRKPYSDDKLEKMLNEKGYNIARRTVAKYREQMNIPVARLRKEL